MTTTEESTMCFTGRNGKDVRAWLEGPTPAHRHWVQRNQAVNQTWPYIREPEWDSKVVAAVWDRQLQTWHPVRRGDTITRYVDGSISVFTS
jgi:hypothetical protein